jgi:hypothetical protein
MRAGTQKNKNNEVLSYLLPGEKIQFVQFGRFGFDDKDGPVPRHVYGKLLKYPQAAKYLKSTSFYARGDYASHAFYVYTNKRILWVNQHQGHTWIDSIPRYPREGTVPELPEN